MTAKRILCLTSTFPRWVQDSSAPFVLNLIHDLKKLGWQVDALAPHAPGAAIEEVLHDIPTRRFQYFWPPEQQTLCYRSGALINLRKQPSDYLKLPVFVLAQIAAVLKQLRRKKYDIIHSHWLLPQGFSGTAGSLF
ncbi:glycosyltransferase [Desulfobotulus mexicanus]|nr:glycosyltransferase [Desulfobotulus mexicanus]